MFQIILSALIQALRGKLGSALVTFIADYVELMARTNLSGTEKKAQLLAAVQAVGGVVAEQFLQSSNWLVNLAIEALVAKLKQ